MKEKQMQALSPILRLLQEGQTLNQMDLLESHQDNILNQCLKAVNILLRWDLDQEEKRQQ